jgi:hypothetical protein
VSVAEAIQIRLARQEDMKHLKGSQRLTRVRGKAARGKTLQRKSLPPTQNGGKSFDSLSRTLSLSWLWCLPNAAEFFPFLVILYEINSLKLFLSLRQIKSSAGEIKTSDRGVGGVERTLEMIHFARILRACARFLLPYISAHIAWLFIQIAHPLGSLRRNPFPPPKASSKRSSISITLHLTSE